MVAKIGVTVVAGFLGSGKTTLLRRIVADAEVGPQAAVLVNELGTLGLDEDLIQAQRKTPSLHVTQLASGCVCCTLRGGLVDALKELAGGREGLAPRHIFIETSGAALASEVSYAVNAIGFEAPFQTDAVVTLVDAWNARRAHREHPDLFEDQLRTADLVLLNKVDLLPDPAARTALLAELRELAPRASWLLTERADVAPALLIGQVPLLRGAAPRTSPSSFEASGAAHGLTALTLPLSWPLLRERLEEALEVLADTVFRIKGVVDVVEPDGAGKKVVPLLVQAVGDRIELDFIDGPPLSEATRRLIFIGANLSRSHLQALLERAAA